MGENWPVPSLKLLLPHTHLACGAVEAGWAVAGETVHAIDTGAIVEAGVGRAVVNVNLQIFFRLAKCSFVVDVWSQWPPLLNSVNMWHVRPQRTAGHAPQHVLSQLQSWSCRSYTPTHLACGAIEAGWAGAGEVVDAINTGAVIEARVGDAVIDVVLQR